MKHAIVTGASGFIGGHIARSLIRSGYEVWGLSRRSLPKIAHLHGVHWDMTKPEPIESLPSGAIFVHSAALADLDAQITVAKASNYRGTQNAYQQAIYARASHFVFISSASVYRSDKTKHRVSEDFELNTKTGNPYARTKVMAEQWLSKQTEIPVTILRPHVVYGPGDTSVLKELEKRVRAGKILLPVNGAHEISVTHVGNLVESVRFVIQNKEVKHPRVFNIADEPVVDSVRFIAQYLACVHNNIRIVRLPLKPALFLAAGLEKLASTTHTKPYVTRDIIRQLNHDSSIDVSTISRAGYTQKYTLELGLADIKKWLSSFDNTDDFRRSVAGDVWPGSSGDFVY